MTPPRFFQQPVPFQFPVRDCHGGIPLGNGTFGALLWSQGGRLRITINRSDYWHHTGGIEFTEEATFANLRRWLDAGDWESLRRVFEGRRGGERPMQPTRLPMGRMDLDFGPGRDVPSGELWLGTGEAVVRVAGGDSPTDVSAVLLRDAPVLCLRVRGHDASRVKAVAQPPDAPKVVEEFGRRGLPPAEKFAQDNFCGWVQQRPGEPAMCAAALTVERDSDLEIYAASEYGADPESAREKACETLARAAEPGYAVHADAVAAWWRGYWARTARIELPDRGAETLYYLGLHKLAGLSQPGGPAASLQGPWVEEHALPPWAGDYHFNINVQECYWPAFAANQLDSLLPLFELMKSWEPILKRNAKVFAGVEDGIMLSHAVDDRCTGMGGFWAGAVDHGSAAWTGQLMWLYYRHTMDRDFLEKTAYPFLRGTLRVYRAMLDETADGGCALPVSVSPEFGGASNTAWGRNASFQLAIIHFLCRACVEASRLLNTDEAERAVWQRIDERLPLGSISGGPAETKGTPGLAAWNRRAGAPTGREELNLWDGQALTESHRHHSHLSGVYPFDIFDYRGNGPDAVLVRNSIGRWVRMGMGMWTGWCLPWASILNARIGNAEMADLLLEIYRRAYSGPNFASRHDAIFPGFTVFSGRPDIMQIEAALGASAAVIEMLVHTANRVLRVFPAVPRAWGDAAISGVRVEGAFLVSAERRGGRTVSVRVVSEAGETLRIENPWASGAIVRSGKGERKLTGDVLTMETSRGEDLLLLPEQG